MINRYNLYLLFLFYLLNKNRNDRCKYWTFQENCTCKKDWNYRKSETGWITGYIERNHTQNSKRDRSEKAGSRNYEFYVTTERRRGNDWNSFIEGLWLYKGKLSLITYIQLDDTDTTVIVPLNDFFKNETFRGLIKSEDFYGNIQTEYFVYGKRAKTEVIRSFCLEYINIKYKSKLRPNR